MEDDRLTVQLRHATFIDPKTATKSKRTFSLTPSVNGTAQHSSGDRSPLLQDDSIEGQHLAWREDGNPRWNKFKRLFFTAKMFATSDTGKGMFKCALAYLLGSMATFVPALSKMFGQQDSKHLIATITVYFHPARSLGSMLEALMLAGCAFLYTAAVSLISMSVSVLFTDHLHLVAVGHALVLIFFVGGGLGFIGWVKLKMGDPLVNIACSLTSLSLITILTKEGAVQAGNYSFHKITQILEMIVAGVLSTIVVSFLVFPISARLRLRQNMVEVTDALSDMLGLITKSFISGDEHELEDQEFLAVSDQFKKTFSKIPQSLKESKYEHYLFGTEKVAGLEANVGSCLERIAQSIGGLRSAAAMQFVIVKELPVVSNAAEASHSHNLQIGSPGRPKFPGTDYIPDASVGNGTTGPEQSKPAVPWLHPQQRFELFIDHLGPSMRSLAFTLKEILDELPFDPDTGYVVSSNPRFELSLDRALLLYREARQNALKAVYDSKYMDRTRPVEVEADWEEAAACCGHFSFSLLEVAEQIKEFLHCLDELQIETEDRPSNKTWKWLQFWKRGQTYESVRPAEDSIQAQADESMNFRNPEPVDRRYDHLSSRNATSTWKVRLFRRIYDWFAVLRQEDNKFGIKVGFGALLYALPSFISATRPVYSHWRGEWGLLSYMLVCSMTIGASNTTGYQRFVGTGMGAVLAIASWEISGDNPVVFAFFGFCMAYWTAWIILGKGKGPMGRFIMLTYNLSALYAYALLTADFPDDDDEEDPSKNPLIYNIAWHRVVSVLTGCIWGMIITRAVWPISARQKLKDGLSLLWLRMGLIWKRDPLSVFTDGESPHQYMNLREENELQRFLSKLQGLVEASSHEFEFRRPFPRDAYSRILRSTNRMLEAFHTMNVVILKDPEATAGELSLLKFTAKERAALCSRISHQFSVIASSMKLEYSIATDAMPTTDHSRDRLLARVFAYRKEDTQEQKTKDEDYSLLYTYALVTGQIGMELTTVLAEVEALFGVLDEESLWLQ